MNFKTTGLLLVLVVAGGAVMWLMPQDRPTDSEPDTPDADTRRYVLDPRPTGVDELVRVRLERQGQPNLVFVRSAEKDASGRIGWNMVEPLESAVESYVI